MRPPGPQRGGSETLRRRLRRQAQPLTRLSRRQALTLIRGEIVEQLKDVLTHTVRRYYVTEVLRIVAATYGDRVIFKGGTSLSKGWQLIDRFSEDVDLFVDPARFVPALGGARAIDRELRTLRDAVGLHLALMLLADLGHTIGGRGRADHFGYATRFAELPGVAATVRVEPGVQSGDHPVEQRQISSLVAEFLTERGQGDIADDLTTFEMTLLHFRRTFVEKLFTIHSKVIDRTAPHAHRRLRRAMRAAVPGSVRAVRGCAEQLRAPPRTPVVARADWSERCDTMTPTRHPRRPGCRRRPTPAAPLGPRCAKPSPPSSHRLRTASWSSSTRSARMREPA